MIYEKNLTQDLRLRLSELDMNYLRKLSTERSVSVSEVIRSIIGDYRRSSEAINTLQSALNLLNDPAKLEEFKKYEKENAVHGDTETPINNKL